MAIDATEWHTAPVANLRQLPAVHALVEDAALAEDVGSFGREAVVSAARRVIESARDQLRERGEVPERAALLAAVQGVLNARPRPYRPVINATGVVLHTNLGRAPLPDAAWQAMAAAAGYCDLEFDLDTGKRTSRLRGVEAPLCAVTGAEAGLVVNNNAAAILLALAGLAGTRPTAVSRGHLVEIGGGFRLPEIMQASGSPLLEVGTTNRTHLTDYEQAITRGAAAILLVHRSNFVMQGYVSEPETAQVIALGRQHAVPVILDLGSGALLDTTAHGLPAEMTVGAAVSLGHDLVCFSGDKLLGGPQAGYVVGRKAAVDRLREHPLARAMRCDKLQLAGILATLELYRRNEAVRQIPIWRFISTPESTLRSRAETWQNQLGSGQVVEAAGAVGGGSLPDAVLKGWALALSPKNAEALLSTLRAGEPPVIAHIVDDQVLLHPRTVPPEQDEQLVAVVRAALTT